MIFRIKKQGDLRLFTVPTRCEWGISFTVPLTRIYFSTPVPEVLPENLVEPEPEPEPGQPTKQSCASSAFINSHPGTNSGA